MQDQIIQHFAGQETQLDLDGGFMAFLAQANDVLVHFAETLGGFGNLAGQVDGRGVAGQLLLNQGGILADGDEQVGEGLAHGGQNGAKGMEFNAFQGRGMGLAIVGRELAKNALFEAFLGGYCLS